MLTKIAVLGVGRVGSAIARTALAAGIEVNVAASGSPEDIALLTEIVIPGAVALTAGEAVADADLVVLAIPLHKFGTLDPSLLAGRVVIDAMNHWAPTDGALPELLQEDRSTSELVAEHLAGARLVKTLNHIGYHELEEDARRDDRAGRRALAFATDDAEAAAATSELLERFGFDAVYAGPLSTGAAFQSGTPIFVARLDADGMRRALADAGVTAPADEVLAIR